MCPSIRSPSVWITPHRHLDQSVLLLSRGDMKPWLRGEQGGKKPEPGYYSLLRIETLLTAEGNHRVSHN